LVEAWKGGLKPLALAGIGLTALLGLVHYVRNGPNRVGEEDEQKGSDVLGRGA
jgi:formate dehydrogenase iron-sulfur subunit